MKTLNINKRTGYLGVTFLFAILLLSFSWVIGQEEYLTQYTKDQITTKSSMKTNYVVYTVNLNDDEPNFENEPAAEIEKWMYDINLWIVDELEQEEEAEIEDWMLDINLWTEEAAIDEEMEIEDWMLDTEFWNKELSTENEMEIEAWMLDANLWQENIMAQNEKEELLNLENWMSDTNYWTN